VTFIKRYRYELIFFIIFCLSRAPYLGAEMFNTDVWKWKSRIYDFGSGVFNLDFDKTLQKYHPGVTLMWVGTAAVKFEGLYCSVVTCPNEEADAVGAIFHLHLFQKCFVVLAIGLTLALAFYPLRKLFGKKYAAITMSLLCFEPFFYALTRVIHLEGLMTSFMLTSFIWLFYTLETSKEKTRIKPQGLAVSAVFAGLAILTKSSAIFMLPFAAVAVFLYQRKNIKLMLKTLSLWTLITVGTFFILWPSMWVQPIKTLDYVFVRGIMETGLEGEHGQLFLGRYTENPGPLYYFVVAAYRFSPFLLAGLIFFGFVFKKLLPHFDTERTKRFVFLCITFTLGYLIEITIPTKKLDRYILPSLMSIVLLGGFIYTWLIFVVIPKAWRYGVAGAFVLVLAFQSLSLTPDYFSYYNPALGGLSKGIYVLEPKWIIGQHEIAKYLANLIKTNNLEPFTQGQSFDNQKDLSRKLTVAFPEKYYTQIHPFVRKVGGWATIEDLTPNAKKTKYFIYPVWDDYSSKETRFELTYIDSIYLRGVKLYNVYQRGGF